MTTELPPALRRALDLLADPPEHPDFSKGYLDLLKDRETTEATPPKNTGAIQAVWASGLGSMLYDNMQAITRRLMTAWKLPAGWLDIPPGGVALDVGCGPGSVTATLARAAGPDGLALGVDISEPMLDLVKARELPFVDARREQLPRGLQGPTDRDVLFLTKADVVILLWNGESRGTRRLIEWDQANEKDHIVAFVGGER